MPKVGQVEFIKIGLRTPKESLGQLVLLLGEDQERELSEIRRERLGRVHPNQSRHKELSLIREKLEAGVDVSGEVAAIMESMEADQRKGEFGLVIAFWFSFALEHPEVLSVERVKPLWKQSILEDRTPIFRLRSYCLYSKAVEEVEVDLLVRFEEEVLAGLPTMTQLEENHASGKKGDSGMFHHLLELMATMARSGISPDVFETYFEGLAKEMTPEKIDFQVALALADYMHIYHRSEPEKVIPMIKTLVNRIFDHGHLKKDEIGTLLREASDDLADLSDFPGASHLWQQALRYVSFPASEDPSDLIGCAVRTDNLGGLAGIRRYHDLVALDNARTETANWESGDKIGYERRVLADVADGWDMAWYLAVRFHMKDPLREKYLESAPFLKALNRGAYDIHLDELIGFCARFPALEKLRRVVQRRIEVGLNRINKGRLQKDNLNAINYLKAAMKWQKEVN